VLLVTLSKLINHVQETNKMKPDILQTLQKNIDRINWSSCLGCSGKSQS